MQGGKSIALADAIEELLYAHKIALPEQARELTPEVWILAPSYKLVKVMRGYITWRMAPWIYTDAECRERGLKREDQNTYWLKERDVDNKPIRLVFRTSSDPDDLRGPGNLLIIGWDEAAYGKEEAWLVIQGRMIASRGKMLLTTTPRGKNWLFHDVYLPGTAPPGSPNFDPSIGVVTSRSADNPWADQKYLERLRKKFGPDYAKQELDALFIAFEGYVYDFDLTRHVQRPPLPEECDRIVAGVDPGFADAHAVGIWGRRADDRVWHCLDELYITKQSTQSLMPRFKTLDERYKPAVWWVDPRKPTDILDMRRAGLNAKAALQLFGEDGRHTIMPGIRLVANLLNTGRIAVAPKCEAHVEEFQKYAYNSREDKNRGENPVDFQNHAMDAMRYALTSEEGVNHDLNAPRYWDARTGTFHSRRQPRKKGWVPTAEDSIAHQDETFDIAEKKRIRR